MGEKDCDLYLIVRGNLSAEVLILFVGLINNEHFLPYWFHKKDLKFLKGGVLGFCTGSIHILFGIFYQVNGFLI